MNSFRVPLLICAFVCGLSAGTGVAVNMETVVVGNPGNPADTRPGCEQKGAVSYTYKIGMYEVTTGQYCEFLNAVARDDTYELYNWRMDYMLYEQMGCFIQRHGSPGNYSYTTVTPWANRPVNWVSWGDAARFANWLHNGQSWGAQDLTTTEDGSYYLNGTTSSPALMSVTRKPNATWVIPTENEWYKAAYHKNDGLTSNYWLYPTRSDIDPSNDLINPDPGNNANYFETYRDNYTLGSPYWRTPVGEFENSESPYGTFDQGGNVLEWNETATTVGLDTYRGLRGGAYWIDGEHMASYDVIPGGWPASENFYLGFRVARVFPQDSDGDGDVDLEDFTHFRNCFNGPNRAPAATGCADADVDDDNDVDLDDFTAFRGCFNGPNRAPACK